MLVYDIRGQHWWYGSRGWNFLPVYHYILLLCNWWQWGQDYDQWTVYRAEYQLQCVGNDGGNVEISWSLHQVCPTNARTGTERTPYASLSGPTEPIRDWKGTVSWITSLLVMRCDVATMSHSNNSSPWSSDVWIPHWRKSVRSSPQQVKWCALSFGIGKRRSCWISQNPDKPSTLTITSQSWLSWRLELPESGQRRKKSFSCNTIMPGPISVWRPHIASLG